jgi:2-polyprenyl-3-methyl-5-hydroxy-6-metoxy-1,4-benzoquinol methylase
MDIISTITEKGINMELFLCTEILKLPSLHFGYWDGNEALNMENVRKAQIRYNEELISHIPPRVNTILDVGCGIGDLSVSLSELGYAVSALSPDSNHSRIFASTPALKPVKFYNSKFEDLDIGERFDLVLMSESQNYFETEVGLQHCSRYLNPGGYLLICGMFRKEQSQHFNNMQNIESEYIASAANAGFELIKNVDITQNILPTMKFAMELYNSYVLPSLKLAGLYYQGVSSFKRSLIQWYFRKEVKKAKRVHNYYLEYFDNELFKKNVVYATHLYKREQKNAR